MLKAIVYLAGITGMLTIISTIIYISLSSIEYFINV